tara:strand:+ start:143 stop:469 length:327 start_codon:yes stop_codon:yes gene_type:complete
MYSGGEKGKVPKGLKLFLNTKKKALDNKEPGFEFIKADGTKKQYKFTKAKSGMVIAKEVNNSGKFINKSKEKEAKKKRKKERKLKKKEKEAEKKRKEAEKKKKEAEKK